MQNFISCQRKKAWKHANLACCFWIKLEKQNNMISLCLEQQNATF